jgi:alpha-L-arabinofuranosidase
MARVVGHWTAGRSWRPRIVLSIVAAAAGVIALAPAPSSAATDQPVIVIRHERAVTVDGKPMGTIPAGIVGANHRWIDDGLGMWDPATNSAVGHIDALSHKIGLHAVRYPGGTVANMFDFTKAVGPQDQRGCQTSGGFAAGLFAPTDSRYGPDENENYVEQIGGETMVMVPTINRTAADAVDYVEYMNSPADGALSNPNGGVDWGDVRARNGHPEPYGIHVWEFGNEPYLPNQRYWRSTDAATKVAQFIEGGWQRQKASDPQYADNDGLFLGCDLATRRTGTGEPGQAYRVRFAPIALPGDETATTGIGDGAITEPVLTVSGERWQRVDKLSAEPADAKVYAVDHADGQVRFGDGVHGAVPPAGARLSIEYTSGVHEGYLAFRAAMKAVDPTIRVCAGWGKPEFVDAMGSRQYDCLGVHSYSTPPDDGTLTRYGNLQVAAANRDADLQSLRQQWEHYFPDPTRRPDLMVTEYGTLNVNTPFFTARVAHVLYLADLVASQLENDVRISISSNLNGMPRPDGSNNPDNLLGSTPDFLLTGRAKMLGLYSTMVGGTTITSNVTGNPILHAPAGDYPALRVVSSCMAGTTRVMVLNRDAENVVTATVRLPDQHSANQVQISTLTGDSVESYNTLEKPDAITTSVATERSPAGTLRQAFGPHSVTLLEFTGSADTCSRI